MRRTVVRLAIFAGIVVTLTQSSFGQRSHASTPDPNAAVVFNAYCAVCHGVDGTGSPTGKSLHAADLRSAAVQKQSNAALARFISEGKERMPAFKSQLTHRQVMDEVLYIRALRHRKNNR